MAAAKKRLAEETRADASSANFCPPAETSELLLEGHAPHARRAKQRLRRTVARKCTNAIAISVKSKRSDDRVEAAESGVAFICEISHPEEHLPSVLVTDIPKSRVEKIETVFGHDVFDAAAGFRQFVQD